MSYEPKDIKLTDPVTKKLGLDSRTLGSFGTDWELEKTRVKYPQYLSTPVPDKDNKYANPRNPGYTKSDKGHLGDPDFKNLFKNGSKYSTADLTPNLGTEVHGVQLSTLDDAGKNDLALYLETRGLAIFRNQDLKDKDPSIARDFGRYFGPLHVHPLGSSVKDYPELLVTFRSEGDGARYDKVFSNVSHTFRWHSDISFEKYPASFSFFVALEAPPSGGDTVFVDLREAYNRLSPAFKKIAESLEVYHTNIYQNEYAKSFTTKPRNDYLTLHPLVRTHPVTGQKSLFLSRGFIHSIKGLKAEESSALLNFFEAHTFNNPEFQVRAAHNGTEAGSIIAWDNRILAHTHTADFLNHKTSARHHYRITVLGERPYLDVEKSDDEDETNESTETSGSNGTNEHAPNGHESNGSNGNALTANGRSNDSNGTHATTK